MKGTKIITAGKQFLNFKIESTHAPVRVAGHSDSVTAAAAAVPHLPAADLVPF